MMSLPHLVSTIVAFLCLAFLPAAMLLENSGAEAPSPVGHLEFRITGRAGTPIPGRLKVMSSTIDPVTPGLVPMVSCRSRNSPSTP